MLEFSQRRDQNLDSRRQRTAFSLSFPNMSTLINTSVFPLSFWGEIAVSNFEIVVKVDVNATAA
jgi:hypothetical protein